MPEYGREYWERNQVDRRLTPAQLVEIAQGHLSREDDLLARANRYLFIDTNAITTETFARSYHGAVPERLAELAERAATRYDLTFVCCADIPYADTWDRSGDADRAAFQRQLLQDLGRRRVPYIPLRGSLDERVAQVQWVLARFATVCSQSARSNWTSVILDGCAGLIRDSRSEAAPGGGFDPLDALLRPPLSGGEPRA